MGGVTKGGLIFAKFAVSFASNHKILPLSDAAFRCLVEATLWSREQLTDGFLPSRLARARWSLEVLEELTSNDPDAPSLIEVENGYIIHDYSVYQDTRAEVEARRENAKAAGRLGGQAKAKHVAKRPAKRTASTAVSKVLSKNVPEVEVDIKEKERAFEAFWDAYPRKVGRKAAVKAFEKSLADVEPDQLIASAKAYAQSCSGSEPRFIAHPTTWLNQGRWDEFAASSTTPEEFLNTCWENATLKPIEDLTGRRPDCIVWPDPIPEDFAKDEFLRDFRRRWIKENRDELVEALRGRL